ncbi:ribosomal protein L4 domain-containing protein [Mycena haematopus]|nr:ribosomal protein L4 domain-containing protein [Mycena haematopus]
MGERGKWGKQLASFWHRFGMAGSSRGKGETAHSTRRSAVRAQETRISRYRTFHNGDVPLVTATPVTSPIYLTLTTPFKISKGPLHTSLMLSSLIQPSSTIPFAATSSISASHTTATLYGRDPPTQRPAASVPDREEAHGGGVAFGPKPRDFSTKLPRKVVQMGMRVALSLKVKDCLLGVMPSMDWPNGKTKHLSEKIDSLGLRRTLFVTGEEPPVPLERAMRNIPLTKLMTLDQLTVYEILRWQRVVMDIRAIDIIEHTLGKDVPIAAVALRKT